MQTRYNRFNIIDTIKKYNRKYFVCLCDCGKVKEVKASHVISGATKSCGCYAKEVLIKRCKGKVSPLLKPNGHAAKWRLYKRYEFDAQRRDLNFDLSFEKLIDLVQKDCCYCGEPPSKIMKGRQSRSRFIYNGLDRVDNNIGYNISNSVTCCTTCNWMKRTMNKNDFIKHIKKISNYVHI